MQTPRRSTALLLAALAALALPAAASAGVTFTDNAFHLGNWSSTADLSSCPYGGSFNYRMGPTTQMGYWRSNTLGRTSPTACPTTLWQFDFRIRTDYAPAVTGEVRSVSFSALAVIFNGPYAGHAFGPAIRQNGIVYVCNQLMLTSNVPWRTYSLPCLSALDFHTQDGFAHPDFSATGASFECGYFICSDDPQITSFRLELDDWVFGINPAECEIVPTRAPTWGELKLRYR